MKPNENKHKEENDESLSFIIVILLLCITIVFTTKMYVDLVLAQDIIQHYTLRGKDVIIENDQLVFIN